MTIYVLWCTYIPRDCYIVGVFKSHDEAEAGWVLYCDSRQWNRDVGSHGQANSDYKIDPYVLGHVRTEPYPWDDGEFD